jgi:Lar family restriction alleviation protein
MVDVGRALPCPHCGSDDVDVVVDRDPIAIAVRCNECSATGPHSLGDPPNAIFAWNQRQGRLTVVK